MPGVGENNEPCESSHQRVVHEHKHHNARQGLARSEKDEKSFSSESETVLVHEVGNSTFKRSACAGDRKQLNNLALNMQNELC